MAKKIISQELKDKIIDMYRNGTEIGTIGTETKLSERTVYRVVKSLGEKPEKSNPEDGIKMEYYKLVVNGNVHMSRKIGVGTLHELIESTGFCFYEIADEDRPFLVYRDEDEMNRDPDGRHAIGYLTPIQVVD